MNLHPANKGRPQAGCGIPNLHTAEDKRTWLAEAGIATAAGMTLLADQYSDLTQGAMLFALQGDGVMYLRQLIGCMAAGDCLLEWDSIDGQKAPVPLLKDMFGSERRKAKVWTASQCAC